MKNEELAAALRRMKVETGSLVCLGCGKEHDCSTHGCAILREASERLQDIADETADLRVCNPDDTFSRDLVIQLLEGEGDN